MSGARHPIGGVALAMDETRFGSSPDSDAGVLMTNLLGSLLDDFDGWFNRGETLLCDCPDRVMAESDRLEMAGRLAEARKAICATRSLLTASEQPMAVSMDAMAPWHRLMTEVWRLSARVASHRRESQGSGQAPS